MIRHLNVCFYKNVDEISVDLRFYFKQNIFFFIILKVVSCCKATPSDLHSDDAYRADTIAHAHYYAMTWELYMRLRSDCR